MKSYKYKGALKADMKCLGEWNHWCHYWQNYIFVYSGLESCIEDWVDQGSEVKELPSCDGIERRFLLTPKSSFLPSKTQTNRALQLTNNTEIQIKLWVEAEEGSLIKCIKLALFTDSTDGDVNDGRNIFEQWDLCPKNREWDTFYIHPKVNTDTKLKVKFFDFFFFE